jgi:hypothetical protein
LLGGLLDVSPGRQYVSHSLLAVFVPPDHHDAPLHFGAMDEQLKAQLFPPLMVFNLTLGLFLLYRFATMRMSLETFLVQLLIGGAIGLVLGGITYVFTRGKK